MPNSPSVPMDLRLKERRNHWSELDDSTRIWLAQDRTELHSEWFFCSWRLQLLLARNAPKKPTRGLHQRPCLANKQFQRLLRTAVIKLTISTRSDETSVNIVLLSSGRLKNLSVFLALQTDKACCWIEFLAASGVYGRGVQITRP
jgi:hypothetical protein